MYMVRKRMDCRKICRVLLLSFGVLSLPVAETLYAIDQDIADLYPSATPLPEQIAREEAPAFTSETLHYSGYLDIWQGYDNNVNLDSQREKDGYLQITANIEATFPWTDTFKLSMGADLFSTVYYKYNAENVLDVSPYFSVYWEITPSLVSRSEVAYDYFSYPNSKEDSFSGIILSEYLRYYMTRDIYHEIGVEYLKRWYPNVSIYDTVGRKWDEDRSDDRYRVKYEVGWYFSKFLIKLDNEFSANDGNDMYQQYYDYTAYRVKPSIMYFFTDRFYGDASLIYKYFHYKDRRSSEDVNKKVRDSLYILRCSLYYDVTDQFTVGVMYTYSEKDSNDPAQEYSGSTFSGGVYYSF